jgi:hypothetical protein
MVRRLLECSKATLLGAISSEVLSVLGSWPLFWSWLKYGLVDFDSRSRAVLGFRG